ncbi:MAG: insulinase family protein [Clostridia bacterium]|nr:insulinase family protein [Clostridia bacterium]
MEYLVTLNNGMRVILKKIEGLMSVSVGVLVGAGSSLETEQENGISHYIEHMMFKGTNKRSALDISGFSDEIGAQINAFTTKEFTCYYMKSTKEHVEDCFELLSDMITESVFSEEEQRKEKGVIIEEINMCEDTPDDLCSDLLAEACYGKETYGKTILGPKKNVDRFTKEDVLAYMKKYYVPENMVISVAGNVEISFIENLARCYFEKITQAPCAEKIHEVEFLGDKIQKSKQIEQTHLCLALPAYPFENPKNDALSVLSAILGGSMSSRLFQKIREELGLAYSVYSYQTAYSVCGALSVYAGVNPSQAQKTLQEIFSVIDCLKREGVTQAEFVRAKEQLKGSFVLSQDNTSSQMILYGKYLLTCNRVFDMQAKLSAMNALTKNTIDEVASEIFQADKIALSAVFAEKKQFDLNSIL